MKIEIDDEVFAMLQVILTAYYSNMSQTIGHLVVRFCDDDRDETLRFAASEYLKKYQPEKK